MKSKPPAIYLDYHATTPVDPRVLEVMLPYFQLHFGNAASRSHAFGWEASEAVEMARHQIAMLIHAEARDIVFTSGATEGMNFLIRGIAHAMQKRGKHIVSVRTEHKATLDVLAALQKDGFDITLLPTDHKGHIHPEQLQESLRADTIAVCAMWANNETGVVHPVKEIGRLCRDRDIRFICDATQAIGKCDVSPRDMNIDMMAFSGHKFYGPKGIGAVYISPSVKPKPMPLIYGGGHEQGYRSGTLNVPAIVGMGKAAELCGLEMKDDMAAIHNMRQAFEKRILQHIPQSVVNGDTQHRLSTVSSILVPFIDSQTVMSDFRSRLAISTGSACSSADPAPSHVLLAMGLRDHEAKASFRFSFGRMTTEDEVDTASHLFIEAVEHHRSQSPAWMMMQQGIDPYDDQV